MSTPATAGHTCHRCGAAEAPAYEENCEGCARELRAVQEAQTVAVDPLRDPVRTSRLLGIVVRRGDVRIEIPFADLTDYADEILRAREGMTAWAENAATRWIREGKLSGEWIAANLTYTHGEPRYREQDEKDKTAFGRFLVGILQGVQKEPE